MFDYRQRPTTERYREGWEKVFGEKTATTPKVKNSPYTEAQLDAFWKAQHPIDAIVLERH